MSDSVFDVNEIAAVIFDAVENLTDAAMKGPDKTVFVAERVVAWLDERIVDPTTSRYLNGERIYRIVHPERENQ